MTTINRSKNIIKVKAHGYFVELDLVHGMANLCNMKKQFLMKFPINVMMELKTEQLFMPKPLRGHIHGSSITIQPQTKASQFSSQKLIFEFFQEYFTVKYEVKVSHNCEISPNKIEYFRDPELGLRIGHLMSGFSSPDAGRSEEDYDAFPSASLCGVSSPAVLNIALKFHSGTVGLGLLDYSNATRFGLSSPDVGLAVDALGGNITFSEGDSYKGPAVVFTFPCDKWKSISTFSDILQQKGQLQSISLDNRPDWWKRPVYCTYGDQIVNFQPNPYTDRYWGAPGFTEDWVKKMVRLGEDNLEYNKFTVVVDAFWQKPWDADPVGDPVRFPRMRSLVEWLHERGHKVLLWYSPLGCKHVGGISRLSKKFGIPVVKKIMGGVFESVECLDFSHPNSADYIHEICRRLFASELDCLNADGVKLDFLMGIPTPEMLHKYNKPENGMGFLAVRHFLEMLNCSARTFKQDVLLNYSASDPRVSHLFGSNRLHDTWTFLERERRARISALANPDLLIDSDGAMKSYWVEPTYIAAAVYSTPTLYNIDVFKDGIKLPEQTMKALGSLFSICAERTWGRPEFVKYGSWKSCRPDGTVVGESYEGKICWLMTGPNTLKVICLSDQNAKIKLHNHNMADITPKPQNLMVESDTIEASWLGGVIYTIHV